MTTLNVRVQMKFSPFDSTYGERGRPQTNARVRLHLEGCADLLASGVSEKQIRRAAFADVRRLLGLPRTVVFAKSEAGHFVVKTQELGQNLDLTILPA